jgi:hypothetical protein
MRDSNYGFVAINNRIQILKGGQFEIPDDLKYDFPRLVGLIYTHGYERNKPKGRLMNLADRNHISTINALTGAEGGRFFEKKNI